MAKARHYQNILTGELYFYKHLSNREFPMGTAQSSTEEKKTLTSVLNQAIYAPRYGSTCKGKPFSVHDLTANGESKAIGIGRFLIWEDGQSHDLRIAFAEQDWCLAFSPSGMIQSQLGNLESGKACWSNACVSQTWCTHYTKDGTAYADCQQPNAQDLSSRPGHSEVTYTDRLIMNTVSTDGKTKYVIEIYEDVNDKLLGAPSATGVDNSKIPKRPVLVVALNQQAIFCINPTSLNLRRSSLSDLEYWEKNYPSQWVHQLNASSNPNYLEVLYSKKNAPRAHDTTYDVGNVPDYKSGAPDDSVVSVDPCTAACMISSHWALSCVLDPSQRSPCTLWFAYCKGGAKAWQNANTTLPDFMAAGLSLTDGNILEAFNGDPILESTVGQNVSCPNGYFVTRFCGSGGNADCGSSGMQTSAAVKNGTASAVYGQIQCKRVDRVISGPAAQDAEKIIKDPSYIEPSRTWSSSDVWDRKCPDKQFLTGVCVSGKNSDCDGHRGKIECSTYPKLAFANVGDGSSKVTGTNLTTEVPNGMAAVGLCNGGENASDCSDNVFGTLYYGSVELADSKKDPNDHSDDNTSLQFETTNVASANGKDFTCPANSIITQFCGSGENADCGTVGYTSGTYGAVQCSTANKDLGKPTSVWSDVDTWDRKCPAGEVLTGLCVSGKNADCNGHRGRIQCTKYPNLMVSGIEGSVTGTFKTPALQEGQVATGICNGGSNASDCASNNFGTLYYQDFSYDGGSK